MTKTASFPIWGRLWIGGLMIGFAVFGLSFWYATDVIHASERYLNAVARAGGLTASPYAAARRTHLCEQLSVDSLDYAAGTPNRGNSSIFYARARLNGLILSLAEGRTCTAYDHAYDRIKTQVIRARFATGPL